MLITLIFAMIILITIYQKIIIFPFSNLIFGFEIFEKFLIISMIN